MSDGLSIRPQTLRLTPRYRRLRESILRPHLRLTESRYFWERWKSRLGPDATVLIMEVRDRCNRALTAQAGTLHPLGAAHLDRTSDINMPPGMSDLQNGATEAEPMADGCTISASELAAACGFSRVTLWRILQREDVRRFISIEHNYVYDRRLGKKRRTVSTYHVQMEDPLTEADEAHLQQLLQAQGLSETPEMPEPPAGYPRPTVQSEMKVVDNQRPRLQLETTESGSIPKPQNVLETIVKERLGTNARTPSPPPSSSAPVTQPRKRLDVDIWKQYPEIAHYVEEAETLLGDSHSRGFYLKSLKRLYPGHIGIWQRALGLAREQQHIRRSRGALFTRLLRTFAAEAGVAL